MNNKEKIQINGYESVELFCDPINIFEEIDIERNQSEMSDFDLSLICGLIKKYKPHRIMEVGVSAGGTSAVIINCLSILNLDSIFTAVDVSDKLYRDHKKKTGYIAEKTLKYKKGSFKYNLLINRSFPKTLEKYDSCIDLLILDTMHSLPGEILDFIVAYPFLNKDALVVLHDYNHNLHSWISTEFASSVVFNTINARKFLLRDKGHIPDIVAFQCDDTTKNSMRDVFLALGYSWAYFPVANIINDYSRLIEQSYCSEYVRFYEEIMEQQGEMFMHMFKKEEFIKKAWCIKEKILLYGFGKVAKSYYWYAYLNKLPVAGFIVSDIKSVDYSELNYYGAIPVYEYGHIPFSKEKIAILIATGKKYYAEIAEKLEKDGYLII